ncbi:MAG: TIGR04255 family protein [Thermomicrobiales bacterium]
MQTPQHYYTNAPIIEAIIGLNVTLPDDFSVDIIRRMASLVEPEYTIQQPVQAGSIQLHLGEGVSVKQALAGYRFVSTDGHKLFQATREGFTFNQLAPYNTWNELYEEAQRLWGFYRNTCQPAAVTRAAVRFVNRLDLPGPAVDFKEYLLTYPEIAPGLPQNVTTFFMQVETPVEDPACTIATTQALLPPSDENTISVLLDFDVYRTQVWDIGEDEDVWSFLTSLRTVKNRAFEESITMKMRRLIH